MILRTVRGLGYFAGSRWFQSAVTVSLIALSSIWLLDFLAREEERAEKTVVEMLIRNMRTGMQLAMAQAMMHDRTYEIRTWVATNPVRWLEGRLADYRGECSALEAGNLPSGGWCFDVDQNELVYQPRRWRYLVVLPAGTGRGRQLRWRVSATDDRMENGGLIGLRIATTSPYTWKID